MDPEKTKINPARESTIPALKHHKGRWVAAFVFPVISLIASVITVVSPLLSLDQTQSGNEPLFNLTFKISLVILLCIATWVAADFSVRLSEANRTVDEILASSEMRISSMEENRITNRQQVLKCFHKVIHEARNEWAKVLISAKIGQPVDPLIFTEEIAQGILDGTKNLLHAYFRTNGIELGSDLSGSIKLIVSGKELTRFMKSSDGSEFDISGAHVHGTRERIRQEREYLITFLRDSATRSQHKDREIRQRIYSLTANTAFKNVLGGERPWWACDDIERFKKERPHGEVYENQNEQQSSHYNSARAAAIRFYDSQNHEVFKFGVLCFDSINPGKIELFETHEVREICAFAADLLALILFSVRLYKNAPTQTVRSPGSAERSDEHSSKLTNPVQLGEKIRNPMDDNEHSGTGHAL